MRDYFEFAFMLISTLCILIFSKEAQKEMAQYNYGEDWAKHI